MTDTSDLTLSIKYIVDAPRDVVLRCWTEND